MMSQNRKTTKFRKIMIHKLIMMRWVREKKKFIFLIHYSRWKFSLVLSFSSLTFSTFGMLFLIQPAWHVPWKLFHRNNTIFFRDCIILLKILIFCICCSESFVPFQLDTFIVVNIIVAVGGGWICLSRIELWCH